MVALAVILVGGCSSPGGDAIDFCEAVAADPAAIVSPPLNDGDDVATALDHFRTLGDLAPVAITTQWATLVDSLETATTVVPSDPESLQRTMAVAYAAERSAVEIADWLRANCGIDIGPVTTIAPQSPVGTVPEVPLYELGPDGVLVPLTDQPAEATEQPAESGE